MEPLYKYEELPPLPSYKEEDEVTTELEIEVKDYLAEWRGIVDI